MYNVVKDFVLQLAVVVIPIFAYQTCVVERLKIKNTKFVFSAMWALSMLLCMSFPTAYGAGYRLDIRVVPLLLGTLYGGPRTGIFLSAVVILYRLCYGINTGFYNAVLALLCAVPIFLLFQKSFERAKKEKRVIIAISLAAFYIVAGIFWFSVLRGQSPETLRVQVIHFTFVVAATWLMIVLSEFIMGIHRLRLELQNSDKSRIISDLTSVFAHEIRNPMQTTRGFLQLLKETDSPDKKKEYIQISMEELDRANEIIHEFLAFGKPSTIQNERLDAGLQLRRVINIIQTYAGTQNVEIITNIHPDCFIHANHFKINQLLINVLKNAVESMPDGGNVWANCTSRDDGIVEISIMDEGVGMTKEQLNRLGSPFYSLKESGTGLGMMVSQQIISSINGKLQVTSEQGIGTKVNILIPASNDLQN